MKEYCIYVRCKGGTPYILQTFDNITSAKIQLFDMVSLEERRGRPYFVDNDFFENKYNVAINLKYFCLKVRDVTEFKPYSEEEEKNNKNDNKIIFCNFSKKY